MEINKVSVLVIVTDDQLSIYVLLYTKTGGVRLLQPALVLEVVAVVVELVVAVYAILFLYNVLIVVAEAMFGVGDALNKLICCKFKVM